MRTKPKIELDLEKVEEYAGLGLTREEIALSLGVSYSTLNRRVKESEEVDAAMKRGRAKANIKVGNALMKAIEGGNVTAIISTSRHAQAGQKNSRLRRKSSHKRMCPKGCPQYMRS